MTQSAFYEAFRESELFARCRAAILGVTPAQVELWALAARVAAAREVC